MANSGKPKMLFSFFSVNDHYPSQPRTVPQLYAQVMHQCELAESLGYDTFFCAEHHFHEYGVVPDPAVMLAAIAQRTKRIRLGTAISILTFHDPRRLAESYAMLDVISNGRLVYGVGSGYLKHEFEGYNANPAEKRDRFNENLDIMRKLLRGDRLAYKGKFSESTNVVLNVLPIQNEIPMYVAVLAPEAAYHVGKQGNRLFTVPYATTDNFEGVGTMIQQYQKGRAEAGMPHDDSDSIWCFHTHAAETEAELRANAAEPFDLYVRSRLYAKSQTFDDIQRSGLALFGTVDQLVDKVVRLYEMGARHISTLHNFGFMNPEIVDRSMTLFAKEVMPRAEAKIAKLKMAA